MVKAIETKYGGCRFRSRTEARWAVFFDALGLKWEYEKEGFELPSGWYLPDFWIPEWRAWVEVKGEEPTHREQSLAQELCEALHQRVMVVVGTPEAGAEQIQSAMLLKLILAEVEDEFVLCNSINQWVHYVMPLPDRHISSDSAFPVVTRRIKAAATKARSARFERGEPSNAQP